MPNEKQQLEAARAAKSKAKALFDGIGQVCGVGITRREGVYAVKVNLEEEPAAAVPTMVDGVPIVVRVIGKIRKQAT